MTAADAGWNDADWWQHNEWQQQIWEEEKTSCKDKRRKWWADRQKYKKQRMDAADDDPKPSGSSQPSHLARAPSLSRSRPSAQAAPSSSSTSLPKAKAKPTPKPSTGAKPPRGSAGRPTVDPPWRAHVISSDDESSHSFPRLRRPRADEIITPGVVIEELLPELEWYAPMMAIEDAAEGAIDPLAAEAAADDDGYSNDEEGEEEEFDDDVEMELSSEAAAKAAAAALREAAKADKAWNATGGMTPFFGDEPDAEPLQHIAAFSEPAAEPSPVAHPDDDAEVNDCLMLTHLSYGELHYHGFII